MNAPLAMTRRLRLADLSDRGEAARIEGFAAARGGSIFHRPTWLAAIAEGTGQKALGLLCERGGAIEGWLPLTELHSAFFGGALVSSGFGVGGGVLATSDQAVSALCRAAEELASRRSVPTIELRGPHAPDDWRTIHGVHAGFAAPLAPDDAAQLLAIPRKARAEVRKALAMPLEVTVGSGEADLAAHYTCYSQSVRNLGTPVFPRSLFASILAHFGEHADILTVHHAGLPVASVLSLYHGDAVLPYWGGGSSAARGLHASERMYYELMCHARRKGVHRFDFGRSQIGSGPYRFKKNWGFVPRPLVYRQWNAPGVRARHADPTDESYAPAIALWKRLPLPVANAIGPWIARGLG